MPSSPTRRSLTSVDLDHQDYLGDTRERIGWEKAAHLPRREAGDRRRPEPAAERARPRARDRRGSARHRPRVRLRRRREPMAVLRAGRYARRARATRRCAARPSSRTPRARSPRSRVCERGFPSARRTSAPGSRSSSCRGDSRCCPAGRRSSSTSRTTRRRPACSPRTWPRWPPHRRTAGGRRHAARQGHRRRVRAAPRAGRRAGTPRRWTIRAGATRPSSRRAIAAADAGADVREFPTPAAALAAAREDAGGDDRIVVFGSFFTVANVMAARAATSRSPNAG